MATYGERYGKGMFIGCFFTLVMTLGTLPMLLPAYEGKIVGPIIMTSAYVLLGLTLAFLGIKFRREKNDCMPEVYGESALVVGLMFVIIGVAGLIANFAIEDPIGMEYLYASTVVIGILVAIIASRIKGSRARPPYRALATVLFLAMIIVSCIGIYTAITAGQMVGMAMFNTFMISIVLAVFGIKGDPNA